MDLVSFHFVCKLLCAEIAIVSFGFEIRNKEAKIDKENW